jgi:O-acetylserine/cysteine efflux transporter
MNLDRRRAVAALTAAGLLWGTTVPLSKLALGWLPPGWLTFVRFSLAAAVLLPAARRRLRGVGTLPVLASGAVGYGGSVVIQNAGITRTSVSHAALLVGAAPVLVAVVAALWHHTVARPVAWAGFAVSLAGVGLVTGGHGGGATAAGDGLVLASLLLSATFTVAQARLLRDRDPIAVTAVQFLGAALAVLPFSVITEGMPSAPGGPGVVLVAVGLAAVGTLLPFTLFAYAQSRVSAEVAGAFLNLEPLVGAVAGVAIFGDPAGLRQLAGGAAILAGIALSSFPLIVSGRRRPARPAPGWRDRRRRPSRGPGPATAPGPVALRGSHDGPGARAAGGRRARTWLTPRGTHPRGAAGSGAARRPGCPPAQRRSGGLPETRHCCLSSPSRGRAQRPARRCRMGPGPAAPWWHPARRRRARSSHPPPCPPGVAA